MIYYLAPHLLQISDFYRTPVKPVLIRKCDADFHYAVGVDRQKNVNSLQNSFLLITYCCLVSGILVSHSWRKGCRITCWITKDLVQRITILGLTHCWPSTTYQCFFPVFAYHKSVISCIQLCCGSNNDINWQLSPLTYRFETENWGGIVVPWRHTDTRLTASFQDNLGKPVPKRLNGSEF